VKKDTQKDRGIVMVYTGNGKGKTTAALGMALRASGHGQKIKMIQFMKGSQNYGEIKAAKKYIPNFEIEQFGLDKFVSKNNPAQEDIELAQKGLEKARKTIISDEYDLIILDEINVAVDYNLIKEEDVIKLIQSKPLRLNLVLTGRYASEKIMELADMVSEVREIKHHYKKGIEAKPGIEF